MEHEREWAKREAAAIGERVAFFRRQAGLSAQELAGRCAALGFPALSRVVIAKLETGKREAVSTAELRVLAQALGVAAAILLFPVGRAETVEVLPGRDAEPWTAYQWFIGNSGDVTDPDAPPQMGGRSPVVLWEEHLRIEDAIDQMDDYRASAEQAEHRAPAIRRPLVTPSIFDENIRALTVALRRVRDTMREAGMTPPPLRPETAHVIGEEV